MLLSVPHSSVLPGVLVINWRRFLFSIHYGVEGTTLRVVRVFVLSEISEIGVMDSDRRQCP